MDRSASFAKVRGLLSTHPTLAYDRRGYGKSVHLGPAASFVDHVDDLVTVLGGRRALLVGHSYGGNVCLRVAAEHPGLVHGLVIFEAPMSWEDWWPSTAGSSTIAIGDAHGPEAAAEGFMRRIVGDTAWEALNEQTKAARRAEGRALLVDLAGLRGRGRPYEPARIGCPAVIAYGGLSQAHQIRSSVELHSLLQHAGRSTPAVLRSIDDAGHGAHRSHAVDFAGLVNEALALAHGA